MTALEPENSSIPIPTEGTRDEPSQTAPPQIPNEAKPNDTLRGVHKTSASTTRTKSGPNDSGKRVAEPETTIKDADESSKAQYKP